MQVLTPSPGLFRLQGCVLTKSVLDVGTSTSAFLPFFTNVSFLHTTWHHKLPLMTGLFITMLIRHMFLDLTSCKEIMQTVLLIKAAVSGLFLTVSNGSRGQETLIKSEHPWKHSPIPTWKPVRPLRITSWWLLARSGWASLGSLVVPSKIRSHFHLTW